MTTAKFGSFDDLLQITSEDLQPIVRTLREAIFDVHPEACEVVRLGDRAATYGVGPRKMIDGYAYVLPHRAWVNLGFYRGASLPDPEGLLEGTGAKMRHVKIYTLADASGADIRALVEAALVERTSALAQRN